MCPMTIIGFPLTEGVVASSTMLGCAEGVVVCLFTAVDFEVGLVVDDVDLGSLVLNFFVGRFVSSLFAVCLYGYIV